jgi:heme/copper-type cytochrome/quinol oxidase subunit 2
MLGTAEQPLTIILWVTLAAVIIKALAALVAIAIRFRQERRAEQEQKMWEVIVTGKRGR